MKRKICNSLYALNGIAHHFRLIDFGQTDVNVKYIRSAFDLRQSLGKDISAVARNECRFKFFLARRIYSFTDYYRSFAYYSRFEYDVTAVMLFALQVKQGYPCTALQPLSGVQA